MSVIYPKARLAVVSEDLDQKGQSFQKVLKITCKWVFSAPWLWNSLRCFYYYYDYYDYCKGITRDLFDI